MTEDLLDRFFAAIERCDIDMVADCYADDVEIWHNVRGETQDKTENLRLLTAWCERVTDLKYEVLERRVYEGGAVQRHVVHGNANGTEVSAPIAIIFHMADGKITKIYEFLDPASVAAVFG